MQDDEILSQIKSLVAEERSLRDKLRDGSIGSTEEKARMRQVEVALDQCWDLLRQRRARREYGEDPNEAGIRPPGEVENYKQ